MTTRWSVSATTHRWAIVLGLVVVSSAALAEPTAGETETTVDEKKCSEIRRKPEELGLNKKLRKEACNNFECLDGAIVRAQHLIPMQSTVGGGSSPVGSIIGARSAVAKFGLLMTDKGSYYLALFSYVYLKSGKKQGYQVRAAKDALTLPLEDGTELELFAACDRSTYFSKMEKKDQYFCGFYKMSREQVDILSKKKVSGVQQFVVAVGDEIEARRLERTEDGRAYIDWVPRVSTEKSVDEHGVAPMLNYKASCALAWE